MASSRLHFSPFLSSHNHCGFRSCDIFPSRYSSQAFSIERSDRQKRLGLCCSIAGRKLGTSWIPSDTNSDDNCGGWSVVIEEFRTERKTGLLKTLGAGASVAILWAAFAGCTFSGFRYRFLGPLAGLKGIFVQSLSDAEHMKVSDSSEANQDCKPDIMRGTTEKKLSDHVPAEPVAKTACVIVPAVTDSSQHEALFVLKKLKVVEENVQPDALCTRREYARWLVKANSLLERIPKHHLSPSMLLAGSITVAFDDVRVTDPDFWCIQALAEAGIVASKLATDPCSDHQLEVNFFPDSFISRLDLLNWKALLEYPRLPEMGQKILRKNVEYIDVEALDSDVPPELFVDMIAADKSIINRVFGRSRRLQPYHPVTKAQAAVTLACGRMTDLIQTEVSRLEAENYAKQVEIESIKSDLLQRGEIQRFWQGNMNEEKAREPEVERDYLVASHDLEMEKLDQDKSLPDFLCEETALDCRKQLLVRTKEEVSEMYERLKFEKANLESEQQNVVALQKDLQARQKGLDDAKAVMGAEIAALQILREWVEDDARDNQARAKIFEKAAQRWKCGDSFYHTSCKKPAS